VGLAISYAILPTLSRFNDGRRESVIDVPALDAALAMARTWPQLGMPGIAVEVRPIVEHRMD